MPASGDRSTFYITTAIDYPNAVPHMGHAYEKVVADFYARSARLQGRDTRFLIGLDEHGQKIQEAAVRDSKSPQEFVDEKAVVFRRLYELLEISNDDFIRTSEPRHHRFARALYERVREKGDIYKGLYVGDYCISCEKALSRSELVDGKCPIHDRPTTKVEEESYFFRLGKYQSAVREHIETHPGFVVPQERRNEVLARLAEEVRDLSISRSTFDWGVPLPDDPRHVLYVWFDALSNYVSALVEPQDLRARYWPADCHVIGKDILWFHTVIWPAMLLSAEVPLPSQVYVHGFILDRDGRKMAKHLGNVVDPLEIAREYSVDVLRYYFLRAFASGQDGRFSREELEERYTSELANELGNLVKRITRLASGAGGEIAPPAAGGELDPAPTVERYFRQVEAREHHRALEELWGLVREVNGYINRKEPWKLSGDALGTVLYDCLECLRAIIHLASPVMPQTAVKAARALGFEVGTVADLRPREHVYRVRDEPPLFPRRDRPGERPREPAERSAPPDAAQDPLARLDLRAGRVLDARPHPDADKLYVLSVDVGEERPRTVCAGLRGHLEAHELAGRSVLVLANLKPAVLRGVESRGMVLAAARADGTVVPVDPGDAPPGALARVEGVEPAPKAKVSRSDFERAPLAVAGGRVVYRGRPLETCRGPVRSEAEDGAAVT